MSVDQDVAIQMEDDKNTCPICLEDLTSDTLSLVCSHTFHKQCVEQWTETESTCPVCRAQLDDRKKNPIQVMPDNHPHMRREMDVSATMVAFFSVMLFVSLPTVENTLIAMMCLIACKKMGYPLTLTLLLTLYSASLKTVEAVSCDLKRGCGLIILDPLITSFLLLSLARLQIVYLTYSHTVVS